MKLVITGTTDRQFVGFRFTDKYPVTLPNGSKFTPESVVKLAAKEYRLITSNFIIDVKEQ